MTCWFFLIQNVNESSCPRDLSHMTWTGTNSGWGTCVDMSQGHITHAMNRNFFMSRGHGNIISLHPGAMTYGEIWYRMQMCRYDPGTYRACHKHKLIHVPGTWKYHQSPSRRYDILVCFKQNVDESSCPRDLSHMPWTGTNSCWGTCVDISQWQITHAMNRN